MAVYIHTFLRAIQIWNQNWNIPILKFWPPIGTPWPLTPLACPKNFEIFFETPPTETKCKMERDDMLLDMIFKNESSITSTQKDEANSTLPMFLVDLA